MSDGTTFILLIVGYFLIPMISIPIINVFYKLYQVKYLKVQSKYKLETAIETDDEFIVLGIMFWWMFPLCYICFLIYQLITVLPEQSFDNWFNKQIHKNEINSQIEDYEQALVNAALRKNEKDVEYYVKKIIELQKSL